MDKPYQIPEEVKRINKIFRIMHSAKDKVSKFKQEDEEFYYADVEETRSQFTKKQLSFIKQKYDIPISTKIVFAIIEQMVAFLTGGKPAIQLMAQSELQRDWVKINKKLIDSLWYENNVDAEMTQWIKEAIVTGSGYLLVRPNNFYQESTFGVVIETVPWQQVYIDPYCSKPDLSDADYVCIARTMPKGKAEREYGIKIDNDTTMSDTGHFNETIDHALAEYGFEELKDLGKKNDEFKPVWIKDFYEKKNVMTYITPEGYVSLEKPEPIEIPNEEKLALGMQMEQLQGQIDQMSMQFKNNIQGNVDYSEQANANNLQTNEQLDAMNSQMKYMTSMYEQMPNTVPGYLITLENDEQVTSTEYAEIKQKRIYNTVLVGDHIKSKEVYPTDEHPLSHVWFAFFKNILKTYGVVHYIKDIGHGMNKLWGSLIYDMQLRTALRVLYPNQSISDPVNAESKFALPGAWIGYDADPELPNAGKPEITDVPPANQYLVQAITMLQQMAEYITGIFGVVQGNPESAPNTMGATHSLQSYGTQRIKSMSRTIESALGVVGYNLIKYLQRYCPKDKILQLVDPNTNLDLLNQTGDTRFKVRVSVGQSLPTSRQIAASALSTLAGQTQSPGVQELLMQYMLRFMDIQEADEIAEAMDVVKQYEQQLQQQTQQLEEMQSQMKAAQNNIMQKDLALQREKGMSEINQVIAEQKMAIENNSDMSSTGQDLPTIQL